MPGTAKERRRAIRRLRRQCGWQDVPVTCDRTDLPSGGHAPLFVNFCRAMGLDDAIQRRLMLARRDRPEGPDLRAPTASPPRSTCGCSRR